MASQNYNRKLVPRSHQGWLKWTSPQCLQQDIRFAVCSCIFSTWLVGYERGRDGHLLGPVTLSDACPTSDQEGPATFFYWDWSQNLFYIHSLPSADSRKEFVSYFWKNVHWVLLVGLSLPRNSVVRLTDCPDMTIAGSLDIEQQHNNTTKRWALKEARRTKKYLWSAIKC